MKTSRTRTGGFNTHSYHSHLLPLTKTNLHKQYINATTPEQQPTEPKRPTERRPTRAHREHVTQPTTLTTPTDKTHQNVNKPPTRQPQDTARTKEGTKQEAQEHNEGEHEAKGEYTRHSPPTKPPHTLKLTP